MYNDIHTLHAVMVVARAVLLQDAQDDKNVANPAEAVVGTWNYPKCVDIMAYIQTFHSEEQ